MDTSSAGQNPDRHLGWWAAKVAGLVLVAYLLGFAVLMLFPAVPNAARARGWGGIMDALYKPMLWLVEQLFG